MYTFSKNKGQGLDKTLFSYRLEKYCKFLLIFTHKTENLSVTLVNIFLKIEIFFFLQNTVSTEIFSFNI